MATRAPSIRRIRVVHKHNTTWNISCFTLGWVPVSPHRQATGAPDLEVRVHSCLLAIGHRTFSPLVLLPSPAIGRTQGTVPAAPQQPRSGGRHGEGRRSRSAPGAAVGRAWGSPGKRGPQRVAGRWRKPAVCPPREAATRRKTPRSSAASTASTCSWPGCCSPSPGLCTPSVSARAICSPTSSRWCLSSCCGCCGTCAGAARKGGWSETRTRMLEPAGWSVSIWHAGGTGLCAITHLHTAPIPSASLPGSILVLGICAHTTSAS